MGACRAWAVPIEPTVKDGIWKKRWHREYGIYVFLAFLGNETSKGVGRMVERWKFVCDSIVRLFLSRVISRLWISKINTEVGRTKHQVSTGGFVMSRLVTRLQHHRFLPLPGWRHKQNWLVSAEYPATGGMLLCWDHFGVQRSWGNSCRLHRAWQVNGKGCWSERAAANQRLDSGGTRIELASHQRHVMEVEGVDGGWRIGT